MDNDARMIEALGTALTELQLRYRAANLRDRLILKPALAELLDDYARYQVKLLKEGVITTDEDLAEMKQIREAIENAARNQELVAALGRTLAFVAARV